MSIKVRKFNFVKIFSIHSNKKFEATPNQTKKRLFFIMGFGVLVLAIFLFLNFTTDESIGSKNYEANKISDNFSIKNSQENQNTERFGNAFSINPDLLQPEVSEPIRENYDNIPKP